MRRQSPVKPEGILIQIISQMFLRDRPLMCTQQPPFDQRDNKMYMRQQFRRILFTLGNVMDTMRIVFFFQRDVTKPPISNNHAFGRDIFLYERDQAIGRSIRNYLKTYSTKFLFLHFNANDYQSLRFGFSSPYILFNATYEGFVYLNSALKPISTRANHCASKLMQPSPCGLIPPKSHGMLQFFCTRSGLLRHHPPHNVEPQTKRFTCPLKNCSGSD